MSVNDEWDLAPCGLLEVDDAGIVTRANARFLARTGYSAADIDGGLAWTSLLTPAGRIFYETQLAPMLTLNGSVEELLLEIVCPAGRRLPVLITAERAPEGTAHKSSATRVALMTVPDRQQYERRLREAQRQAELANQANQHVRRRLELLARANAALASSLDVRAALGRLAGVLVDDVADWCLVYVVDPDRPTELRHWAGAHIDGDHQAELEVLAQLLPVHASPDSALRKVLEGGEPIMLADLSLDELRRMTASEDVVALVTAMGLRSVLVVPSRARAQQAAVLVLARGDQRSAFTDQDLAEIAELAERTGIAIDNLRLYGREHSISVALQKAMLNSLPAHPGLQLASRYLPAANGAEVGGDWYDAFRRPDGDLTVVVGDVVGHDIAAAAAMGHLRGVIRTIGHTIDGTPADTLARADRAAAGLEVRVIASVAIAAFRPSGANGVTVQWASAGHLPPIVLRADGTTDVVAGPADVLLGVFPDRPRRFSEFDLDEGDTLVLYTDGLVERRDEDLDVSIARLAEELASMARTSVDELCERVLKQRPVGSVDDVAVLAVRVGEAAV